MAPKHELELPCFSAAPVEPTSRGIVMAHEGFGTTTQTMRCAERLAAEGYSVSLPDFFFRTGGPDNDDYVESMNAVRPRQIVTDLETAIRSLRAKGATSIGITGFCMGGWITYIAARRATALGVDACVAFYPTRIANHLGELDCPTLFLIGGRDEHIPPDEQAAIRAQHGDAVIVYPEAEHGFMRDGKPEYHHEAATDAWPRLVSFLDEHLD